MLKIDCNYHIREDVEFILESEKLNAMELSEKTTIARTA